MVAAWLLVAPGASAADGDPGSLFDEPIVDVAVVERGAGLSPDLLTLDTSGAAFGGVRVSLLRRDDGWSRVAYSTFVLASPSDGSTPWLVDLGDGRFAVVSISSNQPRTFVVHVHVDPSSAIPFRVGGTVVLEMTASDTGAADVVGDGASELIVAGHRDGDPYSCAGGTIEVLVGDDLGERGTVQVPKMRLAGAALGEWDGRPGADLLANAYETCPIQPDSGERHHLLGIRLRDGARIVDIPASETDPPNWWPSLPLVVDVDGDGRDEAIVRTDTTISIVDPRDRWRFTTVAEGNVALLAAMHDAQGPPSALVTWAGWNDESGPSGVWHSRIHRVDGSLSLAKTEPSLLLPPDEFEGVFWRLQNAELSQHPSLAWTGDVDGDGCPEVVAPLVRAGCLGAGEAVLGSPWLGTRPLAVVGPAGDRRLLAALGREWYPYVGGPIVPAPAAAGAPGAWRHGPSTSFSLAELRLPTGASGLATAVASPLVDPFASADGMIDLSGPTGSRLLVRALALATTDTSTSPGPVATRTGFLQTEGREFEFAGMIPIAVPAGTTPGASFGSEPFDIRATVYSGGLADRWTVVAATLDAWGNVSEPVATTAIYDVTAPTLSLEVPFLSAPWPFDGAVTGTSEAGMSVRLGDGPPFNVDPDGSFELRTQLAPWPQTLEVTAVDPSGNATSTRVSVMGGADLRQMPWPPIAAVTIIVAVGVSSIRGGRRARPGIAVVESSDPDRLPVIEELGSGPVRRRD